MDLEELLFPDEVYEDEMAVHKEAMEKMKAAVEKINKAAAEKLEKEEE